MSKHTSSTWSKGKRVDVLQRSHFHQTHPAECIWNQLENQVSAQITSQHVTHMTSSVYKSRDTSKVLRKSTHISAMPLTVLICMEFLWSGQVLKISIHFIFSTKFWKFFSRILKDENLSLQIFLLGVGELRLLSCAYKHRLKRQSRWETSASVGALRLQAHRAGLRWTQYNKHLCSASFPISTHSSPSSSPFYSTFLRRHEMTQGHSMFSVNLWVRNEMGLPLAHVHPPFPPALQSWVLVWL